MIVYKRKLKREDVENLSIDEELIYYESESMAIIIYLAGDQFLIRRKRISDNEKLEESFFKTIDEVMEYLEN